MGNYEFYVFIIVIFVLLWLLVYPIAIGLIARAKGRSFVGYFFLSIFLTPIFSLLTVVILGRTNRQIAYDEKEIETIKAQLHANCDVATYENVKTKATNETIVSFIIIGIVAMIITIIAMIAC